MAQSLFGISRNSVHFCLIDLQSPTENVCGTYLILLFFILSKLASSVIPFTSALTDCILPELVFFKNVVSLPVREQELSLL
jgi:hypothetical protein